STYTCRFRAGSAATPFRLPATTPLAKQAGLQTGFVVGPAGSEIHPDATGRVRVQLAWDREGKRDEAAGKWMRVAQRGASETMLLPRVGWTVLTANQEGSVDAPTILCRIHDGEHTPTYALPDHKTRTVFKTATSPGGGSFNEIRFEDKDGAQELFVNASRDMNVYVLNKKLEVVENDNTRIIGDDHVLNVREAYLDMVAGDRTVTIGADETTTAKNTSNSSVKLDEDIAIGGDRRLTTGKDHTISVKGTRTVDVGAALIDASLGSITATAETTHNLLVGGAVLRMSDKTISENSNLVSVQTIGALKMETTPKNRVIGAGKALFETVGGALVMTAGKKYMDAAEKTMRWTVGGKLTAKAPTVTIEAKEKIQITCGTSVITIDATSVTIAADAFDLSEASALVAETALIGHNSGG
ncbi:MAG TPA: type VI secretion system tip protein VgrG, partial [Byssovorax sp.]